MDKNRNHQIALEILSAVEVRYASLGWKCDAYRHIVQNMTDALPDISTADITSLIMDDHEWLRRAFASLDDARTNEELAAVWGPLAERLDTHAQAEEDVFYPSLLKRGSDEAEDETDDAIGDHNKIRDAVAEASRLTVGSHEWFEAVGTARSENSEHLAEEEDEVLPDFRKNAPRELRAELAQRWIAFYAQHPRGRGIDTSDRDPQKYIEENS
jgi:iron-sulfur cluster repair protein YtfE (RIC family)